MGSLGHLKKQASFYLREKLKTARLALTDVTPAELMTEEATNNDPWGPDTRTMAVISQAAFEVDDYWRIVEILHKRLTAFDAKNSRSTFKTLVLLEYLMTHGPESIAAEFRSDKSVLLQLTHLHYVDDVRYDWGQSIQRKAKRIIELLEQEKLLKDERNNARRVSRGIHWSGSFSSRTSYFNSFSSSNSSWNHLEDEMGTSNEQGIINTQEKVNIPQVTPPNPVGVDVGASNEQDLDKTIENRNMKYEGKFKIYSKSVTSLGISTNCTLQKELCNTHEHKAYPATTSEKGKTPETENNNAEYPTNDDWQPFEGNGKLSTEKALSICHSSLSDIKISMKNDDDKEETGVEDCSKFSKNNAADGLHVDDYQPENESEPLLSIDEQNSPAAFACNPIHPFHDADNDTTECFLSQRHKKSPVSILDFHLSARRVVNP